MAATSPRAESVMLRRPTRARQLHPRLSHWRLVTPSTALDSGLGVMIVTTTPPGSRNAGKSAHQERRSTFQPATAPVQPAITAGVHLGAIWISRIAGAVMRANRFVWEGADNRLQAAYCPPSIIIEMRRAVARL